MGMTKGKRIDKWIDLDSLPRDDNNKIQWKKSVGCKLKFRYNNINGVIKILKCEKYTNKAVIFIDGYTDKDGYTICVDQLKTCSLKNVLRKPIVQTNPELVKYFVDQNDACKYSNNSGKIINAKCPFCGTVKRYRIQDLHLKGFSCPVCSDGVSWPNKFMYNILSQLDVYFINEVTRKYKGFEWVGNYRYDFYFKKDNRCYMVEMDGEMHFTDNFRTYEECHDSDITKDKLAKMHNITVIRIDCRYRSVGSRFSEIKKRILNSELSEILDLSHIDWDAANERAINSNVIAVAKMWDNGMHNKKIISKEIGISVSTVEKYLKLSEDIGISTYNKTKDRIDGFNRVATALSKPVILFKDGIAINVFASTTELDEKSIDLYGVHIRKQHIGSVCRGVRKQTCGYTMEYISREKYDQLLPHFQTIQN